MCAVIKNSIGNNLERINFLANKLINIHKINIDNCTINSKCTNSILYLFVWIFEKIIIAEEMKIVFKK